MAETYTEAQRALMSATFALGQAQRELDEAERKFRACLAQVEIWQDLALPSSEDVRGILAPVPNGDKA